jgi:hypothetical protein
MKTLTALFAITLFYFLAGCSDRVESPVSPRQNTTGLSKDNEVPFNTTYDGVSTITPTSPYSAHAVTDGRGNATHVGYYTSTSSNDLYYTSATDGIIANGVHTTFTPSGDEMYATYSGTFNIANGIATYTLDYIFDGGTGRFVNLYGEFQAVCTTDDVGQLTLEISGSGSGYIIY